jgi:hypothetical protein
MHRSEASLAGRNSKPSRRDGFFLRSRLALTGVVLLFARIAVAQSPCPDSTMLTRSIGQEISTAYTAWRANPRSRPLEPCWFTAVARAPYAHSDSVVLEALELSGEALRQLPENPEVLFARLVLLSRVGHYAEVPPTMDALFIARTSATTEETHRLTVAAVMQLHDTAAITNRLANAAARFPRSMTLAPEYDVWRQIPRLRALIDTVHRIIKKDPTLTAGLVNLSSIYGNLDQPDSAIAYAGRALRAGVDRGAVAKALESLIGVRMRRAKILDSPELWAATLPVARAVDSALTTPASKYLIALSLAEIVKSEARMAQYIGYGIESGAAEGFTLPVTTASGETHLRVMTCARLAELEGMIVAARSTLAAGGDRFAVATVPALRAGLNAMTATLARLKPGCTS